MNYFTENKVDKTLGQKEQGLRRGINTEIINIRNEKMTLLEILQILKDNGRT